ncbi:GNAT family N-acetyltransferase [Flavobacterium sp. ASW18X]|uniref:GNAT family N-acetyltransferase n=1 Tax=Flavobacterium sp. ASW18X TaxID=2572595 RepID=UPI0010AE6174|nr:GNAT family N-acetyltransferase [Flavobacterium sp. ASW18X]TKD65817.1 GNAT family N-acetyltransferase [Flavobacterium sp. ASW18X]
MSTVEIKRATLATIADVAFLFDAYRVFYKQTSDVAAAHKFLTERLSKDESVIFVAYLEGNPVGFTQLYTSFSSVSLQPLFILNDLFVEGAHRGKGIGEQLLFAAKTLCKQNNYKGVALETAEDNPAQHLYEKLGWIKDNGFLHYFWSCN